MTVLMPTSCWSIRSPTPSRSCRRTAHNSDQLTGPLPSLPPSPPPAISYPAPAPFRPVGGGTLPDAVRVEEAGSSGGGGRRRGWIPSASSAAITSATSASTASSTSCESALSRRST